MKPPLPFRQRILELIARIPAGQVATYGQIAMLAGYPRRARHVGFTLASLGPEQAVPWHRVINAQGRVSARGGRSARRREGVEQLQERLLKAEGLPFKRGRIDLERFRWEPVIDRRWARVLGQ